MSSPSDFYAEDGDWPPSRIAPFVRFVMREARKTFHGVRVNRTLNGVSVIAESVPQVFAGAWSVSVAGRTTVRVGDGTVNGRVPWLYGRSLDGLDSDGKTDPQGVPMLIIEGGPGERLRSYVCLRVVIDSKTGAMDVDVPESLTLAHRQTLHPAFAEGGAPDEERVGYWPLAQLQWSADGKRVERVRQWAYFNYVHRFQKSNDGRPGRHWFRPA